MFYIIILIVQKNYISDMYPVKILDLSAQLFFPCTCDAIWNDSIFQQNFDNIIKMRKFR